MRISDWSSDVCSSDLRTPSKGGSATVPTAAKSERVPQEVGGIEGATPMAERVAVLGLLNKRNGLVRELEMKPGESARVGRAIVRLRACEQTAPWEDPPETGAFVQLTVQDQRDDKWYRVFSGWIFKERPERNVIEHPIYDVFVKSCAMTRSEEHTSELQSLMRISYAVFCLKKKKKNIQTKKILREQLLFR